MFAVTFYDIEPLPKVRMTSRSKYFGRAKKYLEYQEALAWKFKIEKNQPWFPLGSLSLSCIIQITSDRGDLSNYLKGIEDALQYGGIITNDKQIKHYKDCVLYRTMEVPMIKVALWIYKGY